MKKIAAIIVIAFLLILGRGYLVHKDRQNAPLDTQNPELADSTQAVHLTFDDDREATRYHALAKLFNEKNQTMSLPRTVKPGLSFESITMQDDSNMILNKFRFLDDADKSAMMTQASREFGQMKQGICASFKGLTFESQAALLHQKAFYRIKFYDKNFAFLANQDVSLLDC